MSYPFNAFPTDGRVATPDDLSYDTGSVTEISSALEDTSGEEPVYYGEAALLDRTSNRVLVTAEIEELRLAFPPAVEGKVRDFELRVEVGGVVDEEDGNDPHGFVALEAPSIVLVAPTGETITCENPAGTMPSLADGTATAKGVTMLYFSENGATGTFIVKGEVMKQIPE